MSRHPTEENYDLRGLNCPLPVLRTRKKLVSLAPGARLTIETTDPMATVDIPAFCRDDGHTLIACETVPGGHRFTVEKGRKPSA